MLKWTQLCFTWGPVTRNMKWFKIKTCSQEGWWTNSFIQGNHSVQISVSSGIHCLVGTQPGRYPPTGEVLKSALPWTVVQTEQEEAGSRKQLLNMDGPRDCHTEWSKSKTERQISYHLYVASEKGGTNEFILPWIPPSISLFQWVNSSFSWGGQSTGASDLASFLPKNPRVDLLQNGLVGSPCSPRDS